MIKLYHSCGKSFVWNANDVSMLRKEFRIVGSLVGCYPVHKFQVQRKWLPLQLLPEETKLLVEKGIAELVTSPTLTNDAELVSEFINKREKSCEEQVVLLKEKRRKTILEKSDCIYEGKKRKYLELKEKHKKSDSANLPLNDSNTNETSDHSIEIQQKENQNLNADETEKCKEDKNIDQDTSNEQYSVIELSKQEVIDSELSKVQDVSKDSCMIQLFTECTWKKSCPPANWNYPVTCNEKLRYTVFKDLWEKKYYLTSGMKFGGDFLAYEGDPFNYHATFIVVCMADSDSIQGSDIVTYGRVGNQVKKTVVLATLNEEGNVEYISLNWASEI